MSYFFYYTSIPKLGNKNINKKIIMNKDTITRSRNKIPEAIYDQKEYDQELAFVKTKSKRLISILREKPVNIQILREIYREFMSDCNVEYQKTIHPGSDAIDIQEFAKYRFQYEYGNDYQREENIDSIDNTNLYMDSERVRFIFRFYYFKVAIDVVCFYLGSNDKKISIRILDVVNNDIVEYIPDNLIVLWVEKNLSVYEYIRPMAELAIKGEDFSELFTKSCKYFESSIIKYRLKEIINYLKSKSTKKVEENGK